MILQEYAKKAPLYQKKAEPFFAIFSRPERAERQIPYANAQTWQDRPDGQ